MVPDAKLSIQAQMVVELCTTYKNFHEDHMDLKA
jgi:hypothetical protein